TMSNTPADGLAVITFPVAIVQADRIPGYFFAQQIYFVSEAEGGYTVLQPRPDNDGTARLHAAFSSFVPGTTSNDANRHDGANGGPGVSCAVEFNGVYGRMYNLEVKS
ncbi:hypothetical protein B0H11DRAFT_1622741, partial [Mycena galericulata]